MWQVQLPTNSATNPLHATEDLPGPNILQHAAHAAVAAESMPERIGFLHACAGSPAVSSFCTAIDAGYYTTWPYLTLARVCQHLKEPPTAMVQGHLDQQRRNLRSTKKNRRPTRHICYLELTKGPANYNLKARKNAATTFMWNANPSADRSIPTSPANSLLHQQVDTST